MTADNPFTDAVTTGDEFETTLRQLVLAAVKNDIDPSGPWVYRNGQGVTDWEVMVTELSKVSLDDDDDD